MIACRHCIISGQVQGVFYRHSTKVQALDLGVTGWVKNLPDGRVEAVICGEEAKVQAMLEWLHIGPPSARVTDVEVYEIEMQHYAKFEIL